MYQFKFFFEESINLKLNVNLKFSCSNTDSMTSLIYLFLWGKMGISPRKVMGNN